MSEDNIAKDGQTKCPKCGATDISTNTTTGKLRCNFCRHEFELEKDENLNADISNLEGEDISSGAADIQEDVDASITLKCESCGAEVVIDTANTTQARCHWCRNMLSINNKVPNGAVPDAVLPFNVKKEEARQSIEQFVNKRKFYANDAFKKEFTTENIMGVYFPYMVVDANEHVKLSGEGEIELRSYTKGSDDNKTTYYDAQGYDVEREYDLEIKGLTVESSKDRLNNAAENVTNNVINAIMPFDTENAVKYDSNYLKGYTSEKRDINVDDLKPIVQKQLEDVGRYAANETIKRYDRGVRWDEEGFDIKGQKWNAAYLPIWLYSYQEKKNNKSLLHYVAVNARTKETMGSVPLNNIKLLIVSAIIEFLCLLGFIGIQITSDETSIRRLLILTPGIIYYLYIRRKYRNQDARHYHEKETRTVMSNLQESDDKHYDIKKKLKKKKIEGANNEEVKGATNVSKNSFLMSQVKNIIPEETMEIFEDIEDRLNSKNK